MLCGRGSMATDEAYEWTLDAAADDADGVHSFDYDVIVIGGGSGGVAHAKELGLHGARRSRAACRALPLVGFSVFAPSFFFFLFFFRFLPHSQKNDRREKRRLTRRQARAWRCSTT